MEINGMEALKVVPPRQGGRRAQGTAAMLRAIRQEAITLDIVASRNRGVIYIVRSAPGSGVRQQIRGHLPGAEVTELSLEEDPAFISDRELVWSRTIEFSGEPCQSIAITSDDAESLDALRSVLFALDAVQGDDLLMGRLHIAPCDVSWSKQHVHVREAMSLPQIQKTGNSQSSGPTLPLIFTIGGALMLWNILQGLDSLSDALLPTGAAAASAAAFYAWRRMNRKCPLQLHYPDLDHFFSKREEPAYRVWLEVVAVLPPGGRAERAEQLISEVVNAYRSFDVYGKRSLSPGLLRAMEPTEGLIPIVPPRRWWELTTRTHILGANELAALWHLPGSDDGVTVVRRAGSVDLPPTSTNLGGGAHVGTTTGSGENRQVNFYDDQLRRHQFYVARSGMGKTTVMEHNIIYWLRRRAFDPSVGALVVIDPHGDLVEGVLHHIPEELVDQVYYLDLGNEERLPRINVLDSKLFSNGEKVADFLVKTFRTQWRDYWGGHMQKYLRLAFRALHAANINRRTEEQYILPDAYDFLNDGGFRKQVMSDVRSERVRKSVLEFEAEDTRERSLRLSSVNARLAAYRLSDTAYGILGHSAPTVDIPSIIRSGGALLVNTASGSVGEQVGDLIGGATASLVDATVRSYDAMPEEDRPSTLLVIDEMQTLPAVDYEGMLSELRKYGLSTILTTQSLTALDEISRTVSATILSNVQALVVFQVSNQDARRLVGEIGESHLKAEDISGQDPFHAYVRRRVGDTSAPPFSMKVAPPQTGDPAMAERIRKAAEEYTRPVED